MEEKVINNKLQFQRQSNFELLRIVAMLMIVFFHIVWHGNLSPATSSIDQFIRRIAYVAGKTGVVIYVLISGYFLSKSKKISWKRFLELQVQVAFLCTLTYCVSLACGYEKFDFTNLMRCLFPFLYNTYWFFTVYSLLFLFAPLINIVIENISNKQHLNVCLLLGLFCVLFPIIFKSDFYMNGFSYFILYYFIGAYIRRIQNNLKPNKFIYLVLFVAFYGLTIRFGEVKDNDLFTILSAITLFLFFSKLTIKSKFINSIALSTFGVYIVHDIEWGRNILFNKIFHIIFFSSKAYFPLYFLFSGFGIFAICILVDMVRRVIFKTVEKLIKLNRGGVALNRMQLIMSKKIKTIDAKQA